MPTDHPMPLTCDLQRQDQAVIALARVLRLARLLAQSPREDVSPAVAAGIDALSEALVTYAFWTHS